MGPTAEVSEKPNPC